MPELTLTETNGDWWNDLVSVDGIPAALEREDEISAEGEQMLAELQTFLEERADQLDVRGFTGLGLLAKKPACTRVLWRGVVVCSHSVPKLNAWAKATGQGVLLWPLAGCGSYQTSTKASAGTHAGGGAIDINGNGMSTSTRAMVARAGREVGLQVDWFRAAISGVWTNHFHAVDPDCPQLASVAASQCVEMFNGGDGLIGTRPDPGWRGNVSSLKAVFAARFTMAVADTASGVVEIGKTVADRARVIELQKVIKQPQTGYWDIETDYPLGDIRVTAREVYTGKAFKAWTLAKRKAAQRDWGVPQDGLWGPVTANAARTAAKRVQGALSVPVDGVWGAQTDKAFIELRLRTYRRFRFSRPTGAFPTPGAAGSLYGPSTAGRPWYSGASKGVLPQATIQWQIKRIQRMVGATVDGRYGAGTVKAVKSWQLRNKIVADGIVGPKTWGAMVLANVI